MAEKYLLVTTHSFLVLKDLQRLPHLILPETRPPKMAIADPDSALFVSTGESDDDVDLFGDEDDTASFHLHRARRQRAELMRREKLEQLPAARAQRTCAQNRMAYVLSGQRLQPTKVAHVFSVEECELVLAAVVDYVATQGGLQTDRHEQFATTDVPASSLSLPLTRDAGDTGAKTVGDAVLEWVSERVLGPVAEATGFRPQDIGLKDLFVVCYHGTQPTADQNVKRYPIPSKQASLAVHSDGCLLSFSLLLNHHNAFVGGGTFFKGTGQTFHVEQGGLLMHDAGLERESPSSLG